jgi:tetraacyldisaccharide-1-P 4'-kinase
LRTNNLIYLSIPTENHLEGIAFNKKFKKTVENIIKNNKLFSKYKIHYNYSEFQVNELEYIIQTKNGSKGISTLSDEEFINYIKKLN